MAVLWYKSYTIQRQGQILILNSSITVQTDTTNENGLNETFYLLPIVGYYGDSSKLFDRYERSKEYYNMTVT